jgi:hypothetical protein
MYAVKKPLTSKDLTADEIADLIGSFYTDLDLVYTDGPGGRRVKMNTLSLPAYYNLVRAIPYRRDPSTPPVEVIARPYYLFKYAHLGLDCKKKCIALGAWLRSHAVPFRLIGSSQRKDKKIHHIYPEAFINGKWVTVDATYPQYKLFEVKKDLTKKEVL